MDYMSKVFQYKKTVFLYKTTVFLYTKTVLDNWVNSGISNDKLTPPIKNVKNGKPIINKIDIYSVGICLPYLSLWFCAYLAKK